MRRSGSRPVAAASAETAARHSLNSRPRSFISFTVRGNSQSRSMPLNPKVRATVMVELMKVARAAALAAMREKSVELELELAPPMEMRVATLERRVLVNVARFVPVEFETTSSS